MKTIENYLLENYFNLKEEYKESLALEENIEIHTELNPKIFNSDNEMLPEVKEKAKEIVNKFVDYVEDKEVNIKVKDIVLLGSNANYNYNDLSDFDLHVIVDDSEDCSEKHLMIIYDALKSLFNDKYDISINGINVEIYVETDYKEDKFSGGVYSLNKGWINKPSIAKIPKIDEDKLNKLTDNWIAKYKEVLNFNDVDAIDNFIDNIYAMRKESIINDGEFSLGNLAFKELRKLGYLKQLRDLKDMLISKQLSL